MPAYIDFEASTADGSTTVRPRRVTLGAGESIDYVDFTQTPNIVRALSIQVTGDDETVLVKEYYDEGAVNLALNGTLCQVNPRHHKRTVLGPDSRPFETYITMRRLGLTTVEQALIEMYPPNHEDRHVLEFVLGCLMVQAGAPADRPDPPFPTGLADRIRGNRPAGNPTERPRRQVGGWRLPWPMPPIWGI